MLIKMCGQHIPTQADMTTLEIPIYPAPTPVSADAHYTSHWFSQHWTEGQGWHDAKISRCEPIQLSPAAAVFHYAQEIFEGMKAYRRPDGNINIFRPYENAQRFNRSAQRMAMPEVDPDLFVQSIVKLIQLDEHWLPRNDRHVLYIRPTMIATVPQLGVHASANYLYFTVLVPNSRHAEGMKVGSAWVSDEYVRAAHGGTGEAKTGGNYAAGMAASHVAQSLGFTSVLFLDSLEKRLIEEGAGMNVAFVYAAKNGAKARVVTPALSGAILHGITRKSVLAFTPDIGYEAVEADMDINETLADIRAGKITEAFGVGTGAVISPLGKIGYKGETLTMGDGQIGPVTKHIYQTLTDIQHGRVADPYGWTYPIAIEQK